jgi:hypothetical protein
MSLNDNLEHLGDVNQVCAKFPIFEQHTNYDCCVRVRGTNLLLHFTGGFDCPFWIAEPGEWNFEDDYIDMTQYAREATGSGQWLQGGPEDVIVRIPDEGIRKALLDALTSGG